MKMSGGGSAKGSQLLLDKIFERRAIQAEHNYNASLHTIVEAKARENSESRAKRYQRNTTLSGNSAISIDIEKQLLHR